MKTDRTHFLLNSGKLYRKDNNIYFDKYAEDGTVLNTKIIPINSINEIYILGKVELDTYTMAFLSTNNILIHIFSHYGSFRGNFYPNSPNSVNKSGFVLLNQVRTFDDEIKRVAIAKEITKARMINSINNCTKRGVKFQSNTHLEALRNAKNIAQIMACEGAFAKEYFTKWNEIIKNQKSFKFTTRSKRPPIDKINAFISYINTRIYNVCLSEIYKTELDPRISFLHEPNYRSLSLHLDLAEIFKPILGDNLIFNMLNTGEITPKDFQIDAGRIKFTNEAVQKIEIKMIKSLTTQVKFENNFLTYRQIIRREANQIKKFICENYPYEGYVN
ncbi:CRISPR-associated endonuclease Cas1 [Campylobacter sp. FMV-PI01]|uniref:CRISPR-associated endonuclease Cas1 n=1 Tax=Campylobacter portucalensis TaxID=2608384 RepID=A0A6L5WIF1_9BACT|nr:CRISPR-associated endonuclease Cas1 [Campylobacter portucalensis]MSN95805.1 CRISPR-associated endonuclease Cas1 [Campylobacter portucalensis]